MEVGHFYRPIVVIVDRAGNPWKFECSGCGNQVSSTTWVCGRCHTQLLGREVVQRDRPRGR